MMSAMPKISIVMPVDNVESCLRKIGSWAVLPVILRFAKR